MTVADFYRLTELMVVQIGIGALAGAVVAAAPPAGAPAATGPPATIEEARAALDALGLLNPALGSNGWAFGADATASGHGLVVGNPHFPWFGVNRFWQLHVTIPGRLDAMGVTAGHAPFVLIGFNNDVAWTHTVSASRRFTVHELTLVPGDPTSYLVDGKPEKMRSQHVAIEARGADGKLASRTRTLYSSRWGPLIALPRAGLSWNGQTAYSMRDANSRNARAADTWLALDRARNIGDVRAAIAGRGVPWLNVIAADRHGDAFYADASAVPDVSAALLQRCAPGKPAAGLFASAGIVVLDGSRSDCDWARDPAAAVPGLTPAGRLPALLRRDWVQNSNDSFWLTNPAAPLTGFSPLLGAVDAAQGMRTRSGIAAITGRLAGAGSRIGLADAQAMVLSNRNQVAALVLDDLLAACADAPGAEVKEGCAALAAWDRHANLESRGSHLFREWWRLAQALPGLWRVPFDKADPVNTPAGLDLRNEALKTRIQEALGRAVATVREAGFARDAPLREVQGKPTQRGRVPLHGGTSQEGVLNIVDAEPSTPLAKGGYIPNYGTSYLQAVTFEARGPLAEAVLVYGQSTLPGSEHAYDQLGLFAAKRLPRLPFHPEEVAAQRIGPPLRLDYRE